MSAPRYRVTHIKENVFPADMLDVLNVIQTSMDLATRQTDTDLARKFVAIAASYSTHLFNHMMTLEKLGVDNET